MSCGRALASPSGAAAPPAPGAPTAAAPPPAASATAPRAYTPKHLADRVLTSRSALEGERKQVTVLFCDIVDSTRLAGRLDAEQMHEVMDRALRLMAEAVHRYEGTVNQFLGDGLMALFGAPVALEDHALRAVEAALAIQETLAGYGAELLRDHGIAVRVRIGLNTGEVVVGRIGDDLRMDYTAIGQTTHLAARMQGLAEPGSVLVTEATHRLVEGYVRSELVGPLEVKGLSEPVRAWRVAGRAPARTRLEASLERGLTPFVGREHELVLLRDCLDRARRGRGQVVGIAAEAGAGKSRLLLEFRRSLEGEPVVWLEGHCLAYRQTTPYLPIVGMLRGALQIEEGDNPLQAREKLRQGVLAVDPALETAVPYLASLFDAGSDDPALRGLEPRMRRQRTFEALRALMVGAAQRRPHVLVLEDVHAIDSASEEYLSFLVEGLAAVPLLLITTQRPGHPVKWGDRTYYKQVSLDLLADSDSEAMLAALLGTSALPAEIVRLARESTDGNPLFLEEITRSLLDRGVLLREGGGVRWVGTVPVGVPQSAQDIIRARIDRLDEPVKRALQTAAVIGRSFSGGLLARVAERPDEVPPALATLEHLELIHAARFFPEPEYRFKHGIIQDVAYQTLLSRSRRALHGAVGRAIEEMHPDRIPEHFEVLAHHFAQADDRPRALDYLLKAGDKAAAAFANREAVAFYEQALGLVGAGDLQSRAGLLEKLASVSMTLGDADASLRHAEAALEDYRTLGDKRGLVAMHLQLVILYWWQWDGALEYRSQKHLEEAAALVEYDADSSEKGLIYQRMSHYRLHAGQPGESLRWARRAVKTFTRAGVSMGTSLGTALTYAGDIDDGVAYNERNWETVLKLGVPIAVSMLGHELTLTLALARDVPRARAWGERALPEVLKTRSPLFEGYLWRPLTLVYTLSGETTKSEHACAEVTRIEGSTLMGCLFEDATAVGLAYLRRGDRGRAREYLERTSAALKDRHQMTAVTGCGVVLGQLEAEEGHLDRAQELLLASLEACRKGGNVLVELWVLPALAEVDIRLGALDRAREHMERARRLLVPGRSWYGLPAPVVLVSGMLARAAGRWDEATRCFEEAAALDRRYELPWDEARAQHEWAGVHLARGGPGDREQARDHLGQALTLFERIGARRDVEQVREALDRLA
jgi:class 3 adenylate cyclase/tetratricopeptide (TPR) repeat protein